jgi:hypothetical protein
MLATILTFSSAAMAQTAAAPAENAASTPENAVLLTIFLKHDQSRPLSELNAQLDKQGYYKAFPSAGIEVVSLYVVMGIGQVVTLRLPASRLREVNRALENTAWGSYRTDSIRPTTTRRSRRGGAAGRNRRVSSRLGALAFRARSRVPGRRAPGVGIELRRLAAVEHAVVAHHTDAAKPRAVL